MDFSSAVDFLKNFETKNAIRFLRDLDLGQLVHSPWLLGGVGLMSLVALIMRWRLLLATLLGVTGFVWLVSYVLERGTTLDSLGNETLLIFVAGGVFIIFLIIYLLFIKGD